MTYAKGLGTHAPAELVFYLGGRCTSLTTDVGIDDERDPRLPGQGTATFETLGGRRQGRRQRPAHLAGRALTLTAASPARSTSGWSVP